MAVRMLRLKNRKEWLEHRTRIGGSEAAATLGLSPHITNVDLYKIKTGLMQREDISERPFVKYGINSEAHLRAIFALDFPQYEVEYVENNLFLNDNYPFAHASLDGWLYDEKRRIGVLEIKTTNILNSSMKENWNSKLPEHYYIQLLHNMLVLNADFAVLKAQLKYEKRDDVLLVTKHYFIERAEVQEDIDYLIKKEKEFWQYVEQRKEPALILPNL